ncbi:MAG: hypothetical protein ABI609_00570 [Acidobacteriota bacterium]
MGSEVAITGYFDSSEGESGRITLAGYLASPDTWAAFDRTWDEVPRIFSPPSQYLHMVDAMALRNEFARANGWSGILVDALLRQLLHRCFLPFALDVPDGPSLLKLYCTIERDEWLRACAGAPNLKNYGRAGVCARFIAGVAVHRLPQAEGEPEGFRSGYLELVFDQGEPFKRQVELACQRAARCAPGQRGPLSLVSVIREANMRQTPGLQAADYLAWLVNRWQESQSQVSWWLSFKSSPGLAFELTAEFLIEWQSSALDIRTVRLPSR